MHRQDVAYFNQISFYMSFAADTSYFGVVSFEIFDEESIQLIHIRARLESYLRYAVNAPRCLSARALFHCASNSGARIGSAVFRQIPLPILPHPPHLLYIYDSEETMRYLVARATRGAIK